MASEPHDHSTCGGHGHDHGHDHSHDAHDHAHDGHDHDHGDSHGDAHGHGGGVEFVPVGSAHDSFLLLCAALAAAGLCWMMFFWSQGGVPLAAVHHEGAEHGAMSEDGSGAKPSEHGDHAAETPGTEAPSTSTSSDGSTNPATNADSTSGTSDTHGESPAVESPQSSTPPASDATAPASH
ncbi:MAG: hypothetical protein IAF58_10880 [Leptolyngbya sp.]|nr:hypothetical protein [Candidatus Melainabacteria bacterium]